MDPDGDSLNSGKETNLLQRYVAYVSDVLSPLWIRRTIHLNDEGNWYVLGCRYRFLFNFRLFLVVLLLIVETIK